MESYPHNFGQLGNISGFMSTFRFVLDKVFVHKNNNVNAALVLDKLKDKKIDVEKVRTFLNSLPGGEWDLNIFKRNISELNEIFSISDGEIRKTAVSSVSNKDILEIRYNLIVNSMLEYSKFSTEFYDALKYNTVNKLSISKIKLLNEFMLTFKLMKEVSLKIHDMYEKRKFNKTNLRSLSEIRLPLELLMLRILYISINLKNVKDDDLLRFARLLGNERISIMYNKKTNLSIDLSD